MQLQYQIDRLLAQRASEWHQILADADESQRAEFVAWLKQSPLHVKEYLETVYTDRVLDHLDAEHSEDVDALLAQIAPSVVPMVSIPEVTRQKYARPHRWQWAAAAGIAFLAVSSWFVYRSVDATQRFVTSIGEQRTIQLEDTSIVTLNADSRIEVRLDEKQRDIELISGEALFKVAHDTQRPFRVKTSTAIVQAVGTQFNVYQRPDGVRVSVLEGRVKVMPQSGAGDTATATLAAGQEVLVKSDGAIQHNAHADVSKTVAWRERRLVFVETPLEEMVHEFNRYSRAVRLRLENVAPGSHHYNGIFDATDPDSLADLLSHEPDLMVEKRDAEIVIRPRLP